MPLLSSGKGWGGFGLTESGATSAIRKRGGYRLNGSNIFITHAGASEIFTVTVATDLFGGIRGISGSLVTKPTTNLSIAARIGFDHSDTIAFVDGVRAGKKEDKMGWRASDTREQFGQKIPEFLPVQVRLSDMATDIGAGRHLTYHASWLKGRGEPFTKEVAMAKLCCSELAMRATLQAIQLLGGAGYTSDYPVWRLARDAKACEVGEGTNEIQRIVIGRQLVKETFGD